MTKILTKAGIATFALAGSMLATPMTASAGEYGYYNNGHRTAHDQCKKDEDKDILVGAAIGAVIGGVVGSNVAADGVRGEGTALGAVVGGLAGGAIADKSIDCDPEYGYYDRNGYNRNVTYGDGTYRNNDYYGGQPRVVYQQPRTGYYGTTAPRSGYYRTNTYNPPRNYGQQRRREVHRRNDARRAYRQGYRAGQNHSHYHGSHICYDRH